MKKKYFVLLTAFFFCSSLYAQDLKKDYQQLRNKETEEKILLKYLEKWQKEQPKDPEMFIAFSNFYFSKSHNEIVRLDTKPGKENNFEMTDSAGNKGYMYSEIYFTDSLITKAYNYLSMALLHNPSRLDIYFGQAYMLQETKNYTAQSLRIINIINKFYTTPTGWLWTDNKPCENMPDLFTGSIYRYCTGFFKAEQDSLVIAVSDAMIKVFPKDVRFYSMAGSSYAANKKYREAVSYYEKAIAIDPKDVIVLHNLAYVSMLLPDKEKAMLYYNEILKYGNEEDKEEAKKRIQELKE
ncbi:MAG: tetratricopeptide repeat protein [Bacteroidota bacterium]